MEKTAEISECGLYRYSLSRVWNEKKPMVLFIMLNPSKADANIDDNTIRRCINFADSWGYGGLMVGNLFAFRATNPKELKTAADPVGLRNCAFLISMSIKCHSVVCAWGDVDFMKKYTPKTGDMREVLKCLNKPLLYIDLTLKGHPRHPLYLSKKSTLKHYLIHADAENYKPLFFALKKIGKEKEEAVYEFTNGRTNSLTALSDGEVKELTLKLQAMSGAGFTPKPGDEIRKKILGIAREMRWVIPHPYVKNEWKPDIDRIDQWCIRYGKYKKPFMWHIPEELSHIATIFETKLLPDFLTGLNK